jgi:hypothetical protein
MSIARFARRAGYGSEQLENRLGDAQVANIRECLNWQRFFGQSNWKVAVACKFGRGSTLRQRGRPRSEKKTRLSPFMLLYN